jgi:hypothetical protein
MEIPDYSFVRYPAMVIAVIALFVIAVLSFLFFLICFQTALIYMCAVLIWLWFGFVYLVIYPTELIIRRIAEYPTGPLLGISALVGGIGLLVQAFM